MKLVLKKVLILTFCLVFLCGVLPTQSMAASSGSCTLLRGSSRGTVTFKVKTGSRCLFKNKLVFKQTKGTYLYNPWFNGLTTKEAKGYDNFTIKVKKQGGKTQTYTLSGSSKTVKLDNNATYTITVTPGNPILKGMKVFDRWLVYPTWSVAKVKGIATCN